MPSHTARDRIAPPPIAETPELVILNQQNYENQRVPDLVCDFRLTTRFLPSGPTEHAVYRVSHQSPHRRPCRINETWYRQRELGNGSFGCVWLERCASGPAEGKLRAVKEIRKDPSLPVPYSRELEAMAKFSHERYVHCFVECYGWYESENMVFIAMEYIEYGDLQNYLNQPFPEPRARSSTEVHIADWAKSVPWPQPS